MKSHLSFIAAIITIIVFSSQAAWGTVITSAQTGNWNSTTTWVGGAVPGSGDDAIIDNAHVVTLDVSPTVTNCTVNTGGTLDASTFTLAVSGTFTLASGATFKQGGTVNTIPGAIRSFASTSNYIFNGTQTSLPVTVPYGGLTWSSTNASAATPAGNLTVNGNLNLLNCHDLRGGTGTKTHTVGGNVTVDGATSVLAGTTATSSFTTTWNISGSVTTQNSGTLSGASSAVAGNAVFNIGGDVTNNGTITKGNLGGTFTLNFTGSTQQTVSGIDITDADNITIANSGGVVFSVNVTAGGSGGTGTLTLTSGSLSSPIATLTLTSGATISRSAGSLNPSTVLSLTSINVIYTGSSPITTGIELPNTGSGLSNLTISSSGGVTMGGSTTVNGTLNFTSGNLTLGSNNLTIASGSGITGASSSNYVVTNSTGYLIQNVAGTNVPFPVGTATTYNPVILNNTGGIADNYSVRVASSTANVVSAAGVVSDQWTINEAFAGNGNIVMRLQWNAGEEGGSFTPRTSGQIAKYSGSGTSWNSLATTVAGGGPPYTASNDATITSNFANSVYGIGLPGALPVELTSFTAAARNGKVELAWATATEVNNYGFEVERSVISNQLSVNSSSIGSRQSAIGNWEKVGFIEGHGTTNAPQDYSFTDAAVRVGKFSYRLKQIDRDGKFEYHPAVEVTLGITPNTVWLDNNYPNPFNPSTKISFVLGTTGNASLKVFDLLGKEVVTLADGVFNSGELQSFTFDASKYSSGIYYYQLKSGNKTEMKKMLLLK